MPDAPADPAGRAPRQGPLRARLARADAFLFGPRPSRPPGPAVRAAIARNARSSEILVCLVQAAAVALFGAVYAVTPKAFPPSAPFEPVPAVLFAYALFTAARFALARRDRLGAPALALSAVLDVAVLMVTIWSFHLQYQAPPAVYLKAPTLLYVFIMIALRALRLEAWPVLLTGAAAMAGWAGLVAYAATAGEARVTGDWLGYMTSGAILIGAEVDKMLAIGAVTGVLAVAVTRARRLMILAAAEREAAGALSRFFPAEIADAIREADLDPGAPGTEREAAVLMVDLRGFSAAAERLGPAETLALLSDYHRRVAPVIHRHGGAIDKYLGDGVLATFGAVRPLAAPAAAALDAMTDLLAEGAAWSAGRRAAGLPAPAVNAALDAGRVTLGVIGHDERLEVTVIGEVVNRVAHMEKQGRDLGAPGLISARALAAARRQGGGAGAEIAPAAGAADRAVVRPRRGGGAGG